MGLKEKIGHSSLGTFSSIIVRSSFLLMKNRLWNGLQPAG